MESLIGVIIVLVLVGLGLYLLFTYVPMHPAIKLLIQVLVILAVVIYILSLVGINVPGVNLP